MANKQSKRNVKSEAALSETGKVIPIGKPIMDRTERDRAERDRADASLKTYFLTPEELAAYCEKHGKPIKPLNQRNVFPMFSR